MAVQAQHPSIAAFSPDFRNRAGDNALEELHVPQEQRNMLGFGMVFSEPQSELTCNASGPRKRPREELPVALQQPILAPTWTCYPNLPAAAACEQSRLLESGSTSTSGRPVSPPAQDLVSRLLNHNAEIDALVRVQRERLRSGLEGAWKRQCRALLQVAEQRAARRLREKEAELEKARRRNAELEERVRQASAESQMWFAVAKNSEAVAARLKASLEEALLQSANDADAAAAAARAEEGYGDTEEDAAQSCCFANPPAEAAAAGRVRRRRRGACRACGEGDACVLLLPCRHLCLCKDCVSKADTCPICRSSSNACLQVIMS